MEEQLLMFVEEFSWKPVVDGVVPEHRSLLVCGMGGSALGARMLFVHDPALPVRVHSDYGLPPRVFDGTLIVLSSYSGNTEEVLDAGREALARSLPTIVVTKGGALLSFAKEHGIPSITLPEGDIEPRMALGYEMLALAHIIDDGSLAASIVEAARSLVPGAGHDEGMRLAEALTDAVPLFYASNRNAPVAYFLKAVLNESAKVPAFTNVVPELCHNELSGFDSSATNHGLSERMVTVFLEDETDHPRNQERMRIMRDLLAEEGVRTYALPLSGPTPLARALVCIFTGIWAAIALAKRYKVENAKTPLIAELKRRLA